MGTRGSGRDRSGRSAPKEPPGVTRKRVAARLAHGKTLAEVARELGLSKSTVSWHARRLGHAGRTELAQRYDWGEVQRYYDAGHSSNECCAHFGFARSAWAAAVGDGRVIPRPRASPLCDLLVAGGRTSRHTLKRRLIAAGIKDGRCDWCGIDSWLDEPLSLHLHHVNGDGSDNRLHNLRLLCPNCHSQTENFAGRAVRRRGR
ncbi:MAG TPA: LuxR C-terminal-related transcriptional regulator [Thermoleophilaceae bacterium]|jgi:DNA-binding transcriptional ArsR family regulator